MVTFPQGHLEGLIDKAVAEREAMVSASRWPHVPLPFLGRILHLFLSIVSSEDFFSLTSLSWAHGPGSWPESKYPPSSGPASSYHPPACGRASIPPRRDFDQSALHSDPVRVRDARAFASRRENQVTSVVAAMGIDLREIYSCLSARSSALSSASEAGSLEGCCLLSPAAEGLLLRAAMMEGGAGVPAGCVNRTLNVHPTPPGLIDRIGPQFTWVRWWGVTWFVVWAMMGNRGRC